MSEDEIVAEWPAGIAARSRISRVQTKTTCSRQRISKVAEQAPAARGALLRVPFTYISRRVHAAPLAPAPSPDSLRLLPAPLAPAPPGHV
ncbi:hypothetical protein RR46_13092 [Papilio xuthus]|uniref:Uncharacterized protein n=1 Tax=Papilio xuthus TaxID=66420 RepID=A0A194PKS2_PAPXU|nr:hypothetical protein RR46_13092 [Papilio xuthus]